MRFHIYLTICLGPPVVEISIAIKLTALVVISMGDFVCDHRADSTKVGGSTKVQSGCCLFLYSNVKVDCVGTLWDDRLSERFRGEFRRALQGSKGRGRESVL